ncbi:MAG: hypothetical protein GY746_04350 [Gammaproteobacteria bacterium]|nr:hypothetical protein [Gammaproteobacteria bacterium]
MSQPDYNIIDTMLVGFINIFFGAIAIMAVPFIYAFLIHPYLALPRLEDHIGWLLAFVGVISVVFMWFILVYGPTRYIRVYAEPAQTFTGKAQTLKAFIGLNSESYPFELVKDENYDLLVQYKLADEKWCGVLFKGGLKAAYWLYIKLDEKTRAAWLVEKQRRLRWDIGAGLNRFTFKVKFEIFYGIILFHAIKEWIYDPLQGFNKLAEIRYSIADIKQPVIGILLQNGWSVRFKILPYQVRKDVTGN